MPITTSFETNGNSTTTSAVVAKSNGLKTASDSFSRTRLQTDLINSEHTRILSPSTKDDCDNNGLSDHINEEHYEFSPQSSPTKIDIDDCDDINQFKTNGKRDLSSDSFRSSTSSSSTNSNSNNSTSNNHTSNNHHSNGNGHQLQPTSLTRANPLRQSFTQRGTWSRSSLREHRRSP